MWAISGASSSTYCHKRHHQKSETGAELRRMANKAIDRPDCYAKSLGTRAWVAFKAKGCPWRGLALDFQQGTRALAHSSIVRSKTTGKRWVDDSAVRKRRDPGFGNIEEIG